MSLFHSIILGLVEGITEFLPISSTFHLIFTAKLLAVPQTDFTKLFEVFIQGGAILAVVFLYWQELLHDRILMKKVLLAFLPTATIGFMLYKMIKEIFFENQMLMLGSFILVGIIFIVVEYFFVGDGLLAVPKSRLGGTTDKPGGLSLRNITWYHALLIGLFQSFAVIPGVSRAGSVIVGMLLLGYSRSESAKFSFMLSIPTILAASAYDLYKMREVAFANLNNINFLAVGFVVSFIFAIISVKWLIKFLQTHSLVPFGVYRLILALLILLLAFTPFTAFIK